MTVSQTACPDPETLSHLLVGRLPQEAAELHEQHLHQCDSCLEKIKSMTPHDALTEALEGGSTLPSGEEPDVAELIDRLRKLPLAADGSCESLDFDVASFLHPPQQDDEIGRLGGHRVLKFLGTGGMGIVFEAEDTRLQRTVALKVMHPLLAASRHASKRFLREARATAAFEHEHVVTIYNVGEDRGLPWLSMRLLQGQSLHQRLRSPEPIAPQEQIRIAREIAAGLCAAHQRGLLHRDIKPENIWLRDAGDRVTIVDFGLARVADEATPITRDGAILGTPDYMAPEQARGEAVDCRCDLFSLGCVMYRMAAGRSPFARDNALAAMHAVCETEVAPPRAINPACPPALSDLIMRLLAKRPDDRPASADDVVDTLTAIEDGSAIAPPMRSPPAQRMATAAAALVGVALLGVVIGLAAALLIEWTTDKGTLIVETSDDKIAVAVENNQLQIRDRESGEEFTLRVGENRLPSGEYDILVKSGESSLELSASAFALVKGGQQRLSVYWKGAQRPAQASASENAHAATDVESREPDWLPRHQDMLLPKPGEALSERALVQQPAVLPGVASWSIETRTHRASLSEAVISGDGSLLATAGYDGTLRIIDADTGQLKHVMLGPAGASSALALSPTARYLASVGSDTESRDTPVLRIWEIGDSVRLVRRRPLPRRTSRLVWSPPDGKLLAFHGRDAASPMFYDWREDRMLSNFGMSGGISDRPFSSDGKRFATTDDEGVHIWDMHRQAAVHSIPGERLSHAQWSASNGYLAVLRRGEKQTANEVDYENLKVEIWDTQTLALVKTLNIGRSAVRAFRFSWSPAGDYIASWARLPKDDKYDNGYRHSIQLWDVKTGAAVDLPPLPEESEVSYSRYYHLPSSTLDGFSWSDSGARLATVFLGKVWLTDIASRQTRALAGFNDRFMLLSSAFEQSTLATLLTQHDRPNVLTAWRLHDLTPQSIGDWNPGEHFMYSLSPDGDAVATVRYIEPTPAQLTVNAGERPAIDWKLRIWNVASGELRGEMKLKSEETNLQTFWSPAGDKLAVTALGAPLQIIDAASAKILREVQAQSLTTASRSFLLNWSPDGKQLAFDSVEGVAIADTESGVITAQLNAPAPEGLVSQTRLMGRRGRFGGQFGSRSTEDGDDAKFEFANWRTESLAWSADGARIAAVDSNRFMPEDPVRGRSQGGAGIDPRRIRNSHERRVHVWSVAGDKFELSHTFDVPYDDVERSGQGFLAHQRRLAMATPVVAVSPAGNSIAYCQGKYCFIFRLDGSTDVPQAFPMQQQDEEVVNSLTWLDDHRLLFTRGGSMEGDNADEFGIYDVRAGEVVSRQSVPALGAAFSLAINQDRAAVVRGSQIDLLDLQGRRLGSMVLDVDKSAARAVAISTDGHYKSPGEAGDTLVYVVLTADGEQLTLAPDEFARRYGWKNNAGKVRLLQ